MDDVLYFFTKIFSLLNNVRRLNSRPEGHSIFDTILYLLVSFLLSVKGEHDDIRRSSGVRWASILVDGETHKSDEKIPVTEISGSAGDI